MKSTLLLSAALVLLVPALPEAAYAQTGGVDTRPANTRAAKRALEAKKNAATKQAPLYPAATRESPKQSGDPKLAKQMEALFKLQEGDGNEDEIIAKADAVLADGRANAWDKSSAAYLAGSAWQAKDGNDFSNAIKYYQQAVDNNGLHNNNHYRAQLQLAQMLAAEERYPDALAQVDKFLAETKSEDTAAYNIKAQVLLGMDKPKEAAAVLEKLLASKPDDKKLMMNLASLYQQSGDDAASVRMFEKMRAAGLLSEQRDYEVGFSLLANAEGREKDAIALVEEGEKKGVLTPTASMYSYIGHHYYGEDQTAKAAEYWTKGAPGSKDGELALNLAKLQVGEEKWAEAKAAAKLAQQKGVKRPGEAWQMLAQAEEGLGNKAAATAAIREAAKHPESKKWADAKLRAAGSK
jgi:tetratricopeptide (TPR) repeat protein